MSSALGQTGARRVASPGWLSTHTSTHKRAGRPWQHQTPSTLSVARASVTMVDYAAKANDFMAKAKKKLNVRRRPAAWLARVSLGCPRPVWWCLCVPLVQRGCASREMGRGSQSPAARVWPPIASRGRPLVSCHDIRPADLTHLFCRAPPSRRPCARCRARRRRGCSPASSATSTKRPWSSWRRRATTTSSRRCGARLREGSCCSQIATSSWTPSTRRRVRTSR